MVVEALGQAYRAYGIEGVLRFVLQMWKAPSEITYGTPYLIRALHATLGEKEEAFEWLERAYEERDTFLLEATADPLVDNLRDDPRFQSLLRRLNFPE